MPLPASLKSVKTTVWSVYMKTISSLIVLFTATLAASNLYSEETDNTTVDAATDSDTYLEEIKATCEAEAEGLPDAAEYVKDCIESMKQSFSR